MSGVLQLIERAARQSEHLEKFLAIKYLHRRPRNQNNLLFLAKTKMTRNGQNIRYDISIL
jgi:hypothetical protein